MSGDGWRWPYAKEKLCIGFDSALRYAYKVTTGERYPDGPIGLILKQVRF